MEGLHTMRFSCVALGIRVGMEFIKAFESGCNELWDAGPNKDLLATHLNPNVLYDSVCAVFVGCGTNNMLRVQVTTKTSTAVQEAAAVTETGPTTTFGVLCPYKSAGSAPMAPL